MKRDLLWWLRIVVPVVAVVSLGVAIVAPTLFASDDRSGDQSTTTVRVGAQGISLVAYDNCEAALNELRRAILPLVGPYGLAGTSGRAVEDNAGGGIAPPAAPKAADGAPERQQSAPGAANAQPQPTPDHSTTNTHEKGVDEPDLVKTDGRRLVTIADGTLRVIDVASRKLTATIQLPNGAPATQLLIDGDRALVMTATGGPRASVPPAKRPTPRTPTPTPEDQTVFESQLVLVDLPAAKVIGTLAVEGGYLDARQIGSVARVVVRSAPRLNFLYPDGTRTEAESLIKNREIVQNASISDWLPRYQLERDGKTATGQLVDCQAVSRPESFTGTSMLTVLTFDLTKELGQGDPVSIVADGDTVYGTGNSLYIADDHVQHAIGGFASDRLSIAPVPAQRTEVYQFDLTGPGKPTYVASGSVDGTLLNQYSLSEYGGHLRIATTANQPGQCCDQRGKSESMITVLARNGETLAQVGKIGGLGVGERIYAVRFIGSIGYVVTFRQTDPLYTVDLSNPAAPKVVGELKITGYSAYLHDAGDGKLIGVGQEATEQGRRLGTQVSLFDTRNLASVSRITQYQLPGGSSEVEFDPHAFLFWPEKGILVVPITPNFRGETTKPTSGALVLRLTGNSFTEIGTVSHPIDQYRYDGAVRRAVVIGDELWTVSGAGALVSDLDKLTQRAWLPFSQ
jgi:hypothetical protein